MSDNKKPEPKQDAPKMKTVLARYIDENNDLVMGHVQVPVSDPRPAVQAGSRITPDHRDAQPGNPLKNKSGPLEE